MLDSSILIASERGKFDLPALFQSHATDLFFVAAITASELLHGDERANTVERKLKRSACVESILQQIPSIPFDLSIARRHAIIWAFLETSSQIIGPHDMEIAATALERSHTLATLNKDEFSRVPGLMLLNVQPFIV